jgi:1-acyl-sn-glycerol-3-phosphate acyltransferase
VSIPHTILAIAFLSALAGCAMTRVAWLLLRPPLSPLQNFLHIAATLLTRIQWRAELPAWPVPAGQGVVIISNHRSSVDPFFLQVLTRRVTHWMVAREYFENIAFGWFLRAVEAIPTNRGGIDTAATKQAMRFAQQGDIVGMFPEGRINMTDDVLLPGRPGAAMVALRAQVPILPCYIEGSPYDAVPWSPFFMRARVKIRFGAPIHLSADDRSDAVNERDSEIAKRLMVDCLREICRLGSRPDFEPRLAGRRWKPSQ